MSAWRSIGSFDGGSLRAWLYRIATNRCLNHLRDESRRPRRAGGLPFPTAAEPVPAEDPSWLEPYPDRWIDEATPGPEARYEARESVALSFVSALQRLPAKQRAVLVLRDVLGFPAAEAAEMLGTTPASVNSALLRARGSFRPPGDRDLVPLPRTRGGKSPCRPFCRGIRERRHRPGRCRCSPKTSGWRCHPSPSSSAAGRSVGEFFKSFLSWGQQVKLVATRANGQPAFGYYLLDLSTSAFRGNGLLVVSLREDRVSSITRFGGADVIARFDLPPVIDP